MAIIDRVVDRLTRRLTPTVTFQIPAPPTPAAAPAVAPPAAAVAPPTPAGGDHAPTVDPGRPPGAGHRANNCAYLDDPDHRCITSYGEPVRAGQDCYHSAAVESRRTFIANHPSWENRL